MCDENKFTKTTFITVPIAYTPDSGIPIGEGACKAVRLKLNQCERNSVSSVNGGNLFFIYYGDAQSQENELMAQTVNSQAVYNWSPIIYCTNLNQVYVRMGIAQVANVNVQVQIYQ